MQLAMHFRDVPGSYRLMSTHLSILDDYTADRSAELILEKEKKREKNSLLESYYLGRLVDGSILPAIRIRNHESLMKSWPFLQ